MSKVISGTFSKAEREKFHTINFNAEDDIDYMPGDFIELVFEDVNPSFVQLCCIMSIDNIDRKCVLMPVERV